MDLPAEQSMHRRTSDAPTRGCEPTWGQPSCGKQLKVPSMWGAGVKVLAGAGHFAHWDRAAEFATLLDQFARGV